jgi:ubiquinone/menaquinone biosynthesis C-methylase UbiE
VGWWTDRVLPRLTDRSLDVQELGPVRERVCAGLEGRVLEIGFGSGLNVAHYPAGVVEVSAVEPSDLAWRLAANRVSAAAVPVRRTGLDGRRLPAGDGEVDAALSTFTLCTIPDTGAALRELRRVLRPGGRFHFAEHGRSPDARVARWQRRLDPLQGRVFAGCHLTRPIAELVSEHFEIEHLDQHYLPGPGPSKPFSYLYVGTARVPE